MTNIHPGERATRARGNAWRIRSARPPWLAPARHAWQVPTPTTVLPATADRGTPPAPPQARAQTPPAGRPPADRERPQPTPPGPEAAALAGGFARALAKPQNDRVDGPEPAERDRRDHEHGDRAGFLAPARRLLAAGITVNRVHPPPPADDGVDPPVPVFLDAQDDLVSWFARTVEEAGATCHLVEGDIPEPLLDHLVAEHDAWEVVVSGEPEAQAVGERLARRGVEVGPATPDAAARAGIGVTSANAGIAATGSIVLDSSRSGSRVAGVLPPVHVCILPADRIVATPSEVLRPLGDDPAALPPSLVLVTGPSRSGDIEQILTIGAHGPGELHIIVVTDPPDPADGDR